MAQAPYPPLSETSVDNLAATAKATAEELACAPSLLVFTTLQQRGTLVALLEVIDHPSSALLQTYA